MSANSVPPIACSGLNSGDIETEHPNSYSGTIVVVVVVVDVVVDVVLLVVDGASAGAGGGGGGGGGMQPANKRAKAAIARASSRFNTPPTPANPSTDGTEIRAVALAPLDAVVPIYYLNQRLVSTS